MIMVGLTGSFASGKSEATRLFAKLGAKVFDADAAARRATEKGRPAYKAILRIFGKNYLRKSGDIDRKKLARHVFDHPKDLKKLNTLIHPGVILEVFNASEGLRNKKDMLVLDVPLLFESKMESLADVVVVVRSSEKKIFERARKRGIARDLAQKILSAQWPMKKKAERADFVIDNDGTLRRLEAQVRQVYKKIMEKENGN